MESFTAISTPAISTSKRTKGKTSNSVASVWLRKCNSSNPLPLLSSPALTISHPSKPSLEYAAVKLTSGLWDAWYMKCACFRAPLSTPTNSRKQEWSRIAGLRKSVGTRLNSIGLSSGVCRNALKIGQHYRIYRVLLRSACAFESVATFRSKTGS